MPARGQVEREPLRVDRAQIRAAARSSASSQPRRRKPALARAAQHRVGQAAQIAQARGCRSTGSVRDVGRAARDPARPSCSGAAGSGAPCRGGRRRASSRAGRWCRARSRRRRRRAGCATRRAARRDCARAPSACRRSDSASPARCRSARSRPRCGERIASSQGSLAAPHPRLVPQGPPPSARRASRADRNTHPRRISVGVTWAWV